MTEREDLRKSGWKVWVATNRFYSGVVAGSPEVICVEIELKNKEKNLYLFEKQMILLPKDHDSDIKAIALSKEFPDVEGEDKHDYGTNQGLFFSSHANDPGKVKVYFKDKDPDSFSEYDEFLDETQRDI
jgi:hypothetical protein